MDLEDIALSPFSEIAFANSICSKQRFQRGQPIHLLNLKAHSVTIEIFCNEKSYKRMQLKFEKKTSRE